jgi:hypothetical protein
MPKSESEHAREAQKRQGSASIVWFEIPADTDSPYWSMP